MRGHSHKLRLAARPPHPDLLPARGEKETALRLGQVRSKRQGLLYFRMASMRTNSRRAALSNWLTVVRPVFGSNKACPDL